MRDGKAFATFWPYICRCWMERMCMYECAPVKWKECLCKCTRSAMCMSEKEYVCKSLRSAVCTYVY